MNTIEAITRGTKTKGDLNTLRAKGEIPAVISVSYTHLTLPTNREV